MNTEAYQALAPLYDVLTDRDMDYDRWCEQYCLLAGLRRGMSVLEAACGTGKMTARLLKQGLKVIGTDISEKMLTVAGETCRKMGKTPMLAACDMRDLKVHKPMDAVIAACDGVNYLLTDADLNAFLQSAFRALKPGGVLAFDFSCREKLLAMAGQVYYDDRDEMTCLWTNSLEGDLLTMDLAFFVRQKSGLYQRVDETHCQRAYETRQMIQAVERNGFELETVLEPDPSCLWREGRVHMAARRPNRD